jgi:hypothetical protein
MACVRSAQWGDQSSEDKHAHTSIWTIQDEEKRENLWHDFKIPN